MDMYMGTRSTYEDLLGYNFPLQINNTIKRHQDLYEGRASTGSDARLWVYCNEDSRWWAACEDDDTSAIMAYEDDAIFTNDWYITFCPAWYNKKWALSLDEKVQQIQSSKGKPAGNVNIMETIVGPPPFQADTWFHETMHMSQLVTSPKAVDKAYGAEDCYDLAHGRNTDAAIYNADSWTITAMAIWAQIKYSLTGPPTPEKYYKGSSASLLPNTTEVKHDVVYMLSEKIVPEGAVASQSPFHVDTSLWDIYTPGVGLPKSPSTSITSKTSTSLSTSTSITSKTSTSLSTSKAPAPTATPSPAPDADICGDWYKFFFDHFEISGKNFDANKFGSDGSGLKSQIKGCGDLTKWNFELVTNDPQGFQWKATGNLPIGTKACVGRAVVSAGGASPDGCTGAG
ncbi:MAG: hypothetical protein M1828_003702 [Chrysothrix sp. TS-e1954]|nr:MAG: hypothetical protein M1828_003702 [Chrysothrix sp. TS-e1954]